MHSLKTSCAGQIFALAKPHDSGGKRTRNRIPKEERKALVESFINKHQNLNNGSFPSLSLTHKEVGGSFYTIREIVREIIQENRVLGPAEMILDGKGSDHLQDQSLSSSIPMDPVPPLSLSPDGFHSASDQSPKNREDINGSLAALEDTGSDTLNCKEVNAAQLSREDIGPIIQHDAGLQNRVQTICDSFATKPQDKELDVDNKDKEFEEILFVESQGTKPLNSDERVNDAGAAMTENTIDMPVGTVVKTFPVKSVTSTMESSNVQPSELDKVCDDMKGTETKVETDCSTNNLVYLGEISSSTFALLEEVGTEVIVDQMPDDISVPMQKKIEEKIVNPASVDVECADIQGTVVVNVNGNIHETKEFSNGTKQKRPTSDTESGSVKNVIAKLDTMSSHARNEVASVEEKATMEKGKLDASDSSNSQKGNNATLNRIKPESWKGESNRAGHETNPLLAVLKSFLTAFVKFWSE